MKLWSQRTHFFCYRRQIYKFIKNGKCTWSRYSFQDDCSFDPKIAAGQYRVQTKGTVVQHPAPDTASHSAHNDPASGRHITQMFTQKLLVIRIRKKWSDNWLTLKCNKNKGRGNWKLENVLKRDNKRYMSKNQVYTLLIKENSFRWRLNGVVMWRSATMLVADCSRPLVRAT